MNKYVRKLLGVMFQSKQAQQIVHIQSQHAPTSPDEWCRHWQTKGFPWRTEPEIDAKRQEQLSKHRAIVPDIEKGIYPFKDMKLSRADIEWLLVTHENGRGPVDRSDEHQLTREGLDVRGADLCQVDLSRLPLTGLRGGLNHQERILATAEQCETAGVHLEKADLYRTHLERASLFNAYLMETRLLKAHLEEAFLVNAHLEKANLSLAHLERSYFTLAQLTEANLFRAHLEGAFFNRVHLERANLREAHLEGSYLREARLEGTFLCGAFFDTATDLENITLGEKKLSFALLADMRWGGANLAVVNWTKVRMLGDEYVARQSRTEDGIRKTKEGRLREYLSAVRANRQLAVELQNQGLNEDAARFAYRAQVLQRKVLWQQRSIGKLLFSLLLALLAGYGYRMWRILIAYLLIVSICAVAYFVLGLFYEPHLSFLDAVLTSITAFHGRVFSEPFLHPGSPQLWITAFEAIMGLVIEGVFIAMLTQKFFGK